MGPHRFGISGHATRRLGTMISRAAAVMLLILVFSTQRAEACSCADDTRPVIDRLRDAKKKADAVFYARVVSVEHARSLEPHAKPIATLEVIETFKGAPGAVVTTSTGNGGDCSYPFRQRGEYVVYAYRSREGGLSTGWCTRTRPVLDTNDAELQWLRTGLPPPKPVSVQRELVSCTRCDIEAAAEALTSVSESIDRCCFDDTRDSGVDRMVAASSPFWTSPRRSYERGSFELYGIASDGGAFRLEQSPHLYATGDCQQRVTLTWCARIARGERFDDEPPLSCRQPREPTVICDESAASTTRVPPLESPKAIVGCMWGQIDPLVCGLTPEEHPLDGGASYPQLRCLQRYGVAGNEPGFRCRMTHDAGTK